MITKSQATEILNTSKCGDCDQKASTTYFKGTPLKEFDDVKVSVVSSAELFSTVEARTQSADWNQPQSFAVFFHVQKIFEKVKSLCGPVEIPAGVKEFYKNLGLKTNMDLLERVDEDMRAILNYARYVEPELIREALAAGQRYQVGQIDRSAFEQKIIRLKSKYPLMFDSYEHSMVGSGYVIKTMKSFEKPLGAEKTPSFPRGQHFFSWIGGLEQIRSSVIDSDSSIDHDTLIYYEDQAEKTKLDGLRYAFSQMATLLNTVYPLPGETQSDYEKVIENLKLNLKDQDKCFALPCVDQLNKIQRELQECLN